MREFLIAYWPVWFMILVFVCVGFQASGDD